MSKTKQRATNIEITEHGVAVLTIDTPGKLNVLSPPVFEELDGRFDELANNDEVKAVAIVSGKKGSFVAGADIKYLATIKTAEEGAKSDVRRLQHKLQESAKDIQSAAQDVLRWKNKAQESAANLLKTQALADERGKQLAFVPTRACEHTTMPAN